MKQRLCINCNKILVAHKIKADLTAMYCENDKCPRYGLWSVLWATFTSFKDEDNNLTSPL